MKKITIVLITLFTFLVGSNPIAAEYQVVDLEGCDKATNYLVEVDKYLSSGGKENIEQTKEAIRKFLILNEESAWQLHKCNLNEKYSDISGKLRDLPNEQDKMFNTFLNEHFQGQKAEIRKAIKAQREP